MKKHLLRAFIIISVFTAGNLSFAQEPAPIPEKIEMGERVTQEEFAVELVKSMGLNQWLPMAAVSGDCVSLLERLGISPMQGWKNKELLTQEDYLVITAKAYGKETALHQRAVAIEKKNKEVIEKKWQEASEKEGHWPALEELLNDKNYFPEGAPKSPYGMAYRDDNGDHIIDLHLPAVVSFMNIRDFLSN